MLPPIAQTNAELGPQVYREAMARLSAAVNVVTTAGPAGRSGFTATAVCSISDEPRFCLFASIERAKLRRLLAKTSCSA
jgi:flavin reductase (DIM6/NTAB) family NADH-FMN oxidoreductase RutF